MPRELRASPHSPPVIYLHMSPTQLSLALLPLPNSVTLYSLFYRLDLCRQRRPLAQELSGYVVSESGLALALINHFLRPDHCNRSVVLLFPCLGVFVQLM